MAEILLYHHAQGLTKGVEAFAGELRKKGHDVVAPDLYDGATFDTIDAGVAYAEQRGFDTIIDEGVRFSCSRIGANAPLPRASGLNQSSRRRVQTRALQH